MAVLAGGDVIDILLNQHQQIRTVLAAVATSPLSERPALVAELRTLLHAHESAEQEIVHPATREFAGEGDIANAVTIEEGEIDQELAELSDLGVDHPDFDQRFAAFHDAVLRHAQHEELEEFPRLRAVLAPDQLISLGDKVLAAEAQIGG